MWGKGENIQVKIQLYFPRMEKKIVTMLNHFWFKQIEYFMRIVLIARNLCCSYPRASVSVMTNLIKLKFQ